MKKDPFPRFSSLPLEQRFEAIPSAIIVDQAQSELARSLHVLGNTQDEILKQEAQAAIAKASRTLASRIMPPAVAEALLPDEVASKQYVGFEEPTYNNLIQLAQTIDITHDPAIQRSLEYVIINELPHYGEVIADAYVAALISGEPIMTEYVRLTSHEDDVLDPEIREPGPRPQDYSSLN